MAFLDFLKNKKDAAPAAVAETKPNQANQAQDRLAKAVAKIVLIPCITEKATALSRYNQYCFKAEADATKHQVMEAVRAFWHVHPEKARIVSMAGRQVRYGRAQGKTKKWKKFFVTLKAGEKIEVK